MSCFTDQSLTDCLREVLLVLHYMWFCRHVHRIHQCGEEHHAIRTTNADCRRKGKSFCSCRSSFPMDLTVRLRLMDFLLSNMTIFIEQQTNVTLYIDCYGL